MADHVLNGIVACGEDEPSDRDLLHIARVALEVAVDALLEISVRTAMREHPSGSHRKA